MTAVTGIQEEEIYSQYSDLFKEEIGTFTGPKVKIYVREDAHPKFYKA